MTLKLQMKMRIFYYCYYCMSFIVVCSWKTKMLNFILICRNVNYFIGFKIMEN